MADHYTYRLSWSAEDQEHVATCAEFPSLSWLDKDDVEALLGIKRLVRDVVADLNASGEEVPQPLADRAFSGRFVVRVPPEQHRDLSISAAEAGVSLNRYVSLKLSSQGGRGAVAPKAAAVTDPKPRVGQIADPGRMATIRGPRISGERLLGNVASQGMRAAASAGAKGSAQRASGRGGGAAARKRETQAR